MTIRHGTKAGYHRHRQMGEPACDACKAGAAAYEAQRQVRLARVGPGLVPAAPVVDAIDAAAEAGISLLAVTRRAGLQHSTVWRAINGQQRVFFRSTSDKLRKAVRELAEERQAALARCIDHLDYADNPTSKLRFPARPLLDAIERRWPAEERQDTGTGLKTLLSDPDRRYLYRSETIDVDRLERVCRALGFYPEDVYGQAWFGVDEGAA